MTGLEILACCIAWGVGATFATALVMGTETPMD